MAARFGGTRVGAAFLAFVSLMLIGRSLVLVIRELANAEPYETRRNAAAFAGLDMRSVPTLVDRHLARGTALSLGPSFFIDRDYGMDFWYRATYAFYPRRIEESASHTLEIISKGDATEGVVLGDLDDHRSLVLLGSPDPSPGSAGTTQTQFDPWEIGIALTSIFGLGTLLQLLLRLRPGSILEVALSGVLLMALAAHVATWLQIPLPWPSLSVLGLVFAGVAVFLARSSFSHDFGTAGARRNAWTVLPLLAVVLFLARALLIPVTEWDGRFVWLFHGAQLLFKGFVDASESATLSRLQPTYPLLTPALFSFGSAFRESFNERTAVLLGVMLHAAVIGATARISMARIGAFRGALFTSLSVVMTMGLSTEAYADGLLSSLLVLQFLALGLPGEDALGWIAMACAALTKREGLLLAFAVALVQKGWRAWRPMALSLAPALVHALWCRGVGLVHELDAPRLPFDLMDLASRSALILRKSGGVVARSVPYGLAATGFIALGWLRVRRALSKAAQSTLLVSLCFLVFIFVTFLVTPQPLRWHLDTALARLALHPSLFALLGAFLAWDDAVGLPEFSVALSADRGRVEPIPSA